jgi:hypothetical protein
MNSVHNDRVETRWGEQRDELRDKFCKTAVGKPDNKLPEGRLNLWL